MAEGGIVLFFFDPCVNSMERQGGALVFKGGYHARVQKHRKRVVFHGEAHAAQPVFRVSKTAKIKKKGMFLRLNKKCVLGVYLLLL